MQRHVNGRVVQGHQFRLDPRSGSPLMSSPPKNRATLTPLYRILFIANWQNNFLASITTLPRPIMWCRVPGASSLACLSVDTFYPALCKVVTSLWNELPLFLPHEASSLGSEAGSRGASLFQRQSLPRGLHPEVHNRTFWQGTLDSNR